MRKIPSKNYCVVVVLILCTFLVTLFLSNLYKNREKEISPIYNYSSRITNEEFDEYFLERQDVIVYISDKHDTSNRKFEKNFIKKIDELNLKDKLIYIDKDELNKKSLEELDKKYNIKVDLNNLPIVISIVDRKVTKIANVTEESNVNKILEYEDFE